MQPYMKNVKFNNKEVKTLFNLRAQTVWNYCACYKSMYKDNMNCQLGCDSIDGLQHSFQCIQIMCDPKFQTDIKEDSTLIPFTDVYAGIVKQK